MVVRVALLAHLVAVVAKDVVGNVRLAPDVVAAALGVRKHVKGVVKQAVLVVPEAVAVVALAAVAPAVVVALVVVVLVAVAVLVVVVLVEDAAVVAVALVLAPDVKPVEAVQIIALADVLEDAAQIAVMDANHRVCLLAKIPASLHVVDKLLCL